MDRTNQKPATNKRMGRYVAALIVALAGGGIVSCMTTTRTILPPPAIPGAKFVGNENCAQCHAETVRDFKTATHARLKARGDNAANVGCESCHGAGSAHAESGGARGTIVNPHKSSEACYQCHLATEASFHLPSHHPVPEGKVSCSDCHNPHKGSAIPTGGTSLASEQETCAKCHTAQGGPFVFEHEAVREGCTTCHAAHGSVNPRMLLARNANLCLKCHFQQQTAPGTLLIGGRDHSAFLKRGTCWTAGCHEAVHGSQTGSSLRF